MWFCDLIKSLNSLFRWPHFGGRIPGGTEAEEEEEEAGVERNDTSTGELSVTT